MNIPWPDWNTQTWATVVMAVASAVTAAATAVLARLSRGTWKLFRLEQRRHEDTVGRIAARIIREAREVEVASEQIGGEPPTSAHEWVELVRRMERRESWVASKEEAVRQIHRAAAHFPPAAMARLDVALTRLRDAQRLANEMRRAADSRTEVWYKRVRRDLREALAAAAGALASSYDLISDEAKRWGGESKTYEELLDEAAAENLEEFPQTRLESPGESGG